MNGNHVKGVELRERAEIEVLKTQRVCTLVFGDPDVVGIPCQVLDAALYAAEVTLPQGSPRRVFIQDFAAALNRRRILRNEEVEKFWELCEDKINK